MIIARIESLILENAVIVGVINGRQNDNQSREYMDELEFLTYSHHLLFLQLFDFLH